MWIIDASSKICCIENLVRISLGDHVVTSLLYVDDWGTMVQVLLPVNNARGTVPAN